MEIIHVDPGYGALMLTDSSNYSKTEYVENNTYNPYSGVAFHLTQGSRIYYPKVDFTFEPAGQLYKKVWSLKFSIYIEGDSVWAGFCHSISSFSSPDVGVFLKSNATKIRRYVDGTVKEESNFAATPVGFHNVSITYAVTAEPSGSYISTSTIIVDNTTDYQIYSSSTMPDIPQYLGHSFAIGWKCFISNVLIGQATYEGDGDIPSDDGIAPDTPIYRLPCDAPVTDFATGENGEYIATENGQTLLQAIKASDLITTFGDRPVNHIVAYGNPGYRVGTSVAQATGISKSDGAITAHGTQALSFDKNTHIYDVWSIEDGSTFSTINGLQVGWRAGD